MRYFWPSFYRKIHFDVVLFVVDALDEKRLKEAKSVFHRLATEEELRNVVFCILYNYKTEQGDVDLLIHEEDASPTKSTTIKSFGETVKKSMGNSTLR